MEDDIKYIDDITKKSFEGFSQEVNTSWSDFYTKHAVYLNPNTNFISSVGLKKISLAVVSFSIVTAGVFFYTNNQDTTVIPEVVVIKRNNFNLDKYKAKLIKVNEINLEEKTENNSNNNSNIAKTEDVIVKIKVPIHKKVEVRKQIIINDSIN